MTPRSDELSPAARAQYWVSRILTISLLMVVPGLLGLWIDRRLGTVPLFAVLGFIAGWAAAIWRLLHLKQPEPGASGQDDSDTNST